MRYCDYAATRVDFRLVVHDVGSIDTCFRVNEYEQIMDILRQITSTSNQLVTTLERTSSYFHRTIKPAFQRVFEGFIPENLQTSDENWHYLLKESVARPCCPAAESMHQLHTVCFIRHTVKF